MDLKQELIQKAKDDELKELLKKAKDAENSEALLALAKENNMEMTREEADAYFAELHKTGELSDQELENVTGGGCRKNGHLVVSIYYSCNHWTCKKHPGERAEFRRVGDDYRPVCISCGASSYCLNCYYCHYESALWQCFNPGK